MTPLRFEAAHAAAWGELEQMLGALEGRRPSTPLRNKWSRATGSRPERPDGARMTALYRATCEHLALAQARAYPVHLIDRLEELTQRAHQAIYRQHELGLARLGRLFAIDFPAAVRRHKAYFLVAALTFAVPTLAIGIACYLDPTFILTVSDASSVEQLDQMYGDGDEPFGRRDASTDLMMFGYYIRNNISVAFQCFAAGVFVGIGSLVSLALNGVWGGSAAGYLTWHGHARNFYSFVITHGAFEITAIAIAGAAGLMLGHALLAPGRRTRLQALQHAASEAVVLIYGLIAMLIVAAAIEAFWSSSRWVEPWVKFTVGGVCWLGVAAYLSLQGRSTAPREPAA